MAPTRWTDIADKHGIHRLDTLHAMRNHCLYVKNYDAPCVEGQAWADLWIGPSRDGSAMLEVIGHLDGPAQDVLIFHSMNVRRSTIERARRVIEERRNQP